MVIRILIKFFYMVENRGEQKVEICDENFELNKFFYRLIYFKFKF